MPINNDERHDDELQNRLFIGGELSRMPASDFLLKAEQEASAILSQWAAESGETDGTIRLPEGTFVVSGPLLVGARMTIRIEEALEAIRRSPEDFVLENFVDSRVA